MDDEDSADKDNIYGLITNLCERFTNDPQKIKTSRSQCYEILLKKRAPKYKNNFRNLNGTTDPICNLLAWRFQLIHQFKLFNHADELQQCIDNIEENYMSNKELLDSSLQFLLNLRNVPSKDTKKFDLSSLPPIDKFLNFNNLFKLPAHLLKESENVYGKSDFDKIPDPKTTKQPLQCDIAKDEGYYSPPKSPEANIWDVVSKLPYNNRRNWESYGYPEPDKERPFLSELGDLSSLWVENLQSLYIMKLLKFGTVFAFKMISRKAFISDLKCLLVGVASDSFNFNDLGQFYLIPDIHVEGVAPDTLKKFCENFVFCGTCFNALNRMSTQHSEASHLKHQGYIYKEFSESISRYLKFYQTSVFSIPNTTNYFEFCEKTYPLQLQISTLASICKVGPYKKLEDIPHGVDLLNYLYHKVLSVTDQKVIMVLYSILYPCCQTYFSRFLKQWILEGVIDDPYGEFFVKPNTKHVTSRGRTFWTRSYSVKQDIMPYFLLDSGTDILVCGKAMNLLKLCHNSSPLCLYLMGKKPLIISCCLTAGQLSALHQNTENYYLDVSRDCGPKFNFDHALLRWDEDPLLFRLVAKKRAATLRRLQLEKLKLIEEQREKKIEEISILKEQYETFLEQKQLKLVKEVQSEIEHVQEEIVIEQKKEKLIRDEADRMIKFYAELIDTAEKRRSKIENQIKLVKSVHIDQTILEREHFKSTENMLDNSNSSTDSFYSVVDDVGKESAKVSENENELEPETKMHSSDSMDVLNANTAEEPHRDNKGESAISDTVQQQAIDNFETARRIKHKVMTEEMGVVYTTPTEAGNANTPEIPYLSAAQRNKLKVLSSEFGINVKTKIHQLSAQAQLNRNKVMGVSDCFQLDNASFVNKNVHIEEEQTRDTILKKSKSLTLDLDQVSSKSSRSDMDKPIPMSVDSTPMSELPPSLATTPSTAFMSIDTNQLESIPSTAETCQTNQEFNFNPNQSRPIIPIYYNRQLSTNSPKTTVFSKRTTKDEAKGVCTNSLKLFLQESIRIPLKAQLRLVNNELLKYFINDLMYFKHLSNLRDYFFLQDGEFSQNITDNLFTKLYDANFPRELINCRTLQSLVFGALDLSSKNPGNPHCLSFKINSLPNCFDLGNPDVLECISLTYKVQWPLNILLPSDTVGKYGEVFKFLLKLNRVSWILKNIFLALKVLAKETREKRIYLMSSPHFRRLHQCRHVMTHFVQTLQNYVVGEVLQSSWQVFIKSLSDVTNVEELYVAHTVYIKKILFMCLLNQKTAVFRSVLHKIFVVILKFYDYLRSRSWICENGQYVHPNFNKLESIFKNFEELVVYFYKVGRKVAKCGYQPHLFQLLDTLDINNYISQSLNKSTA